MSHVQISAWRLTIMTEGFFVIFLHATREMLRFYFKLGHIFLLYHVLLYIDHHIQCYIFWAVDSIIKWTVDNTYQVLCITISSVWCSAILYSMRLCNIVCVGPTCAPLQPSLLELVESLKVAVHTKQSKNVDVLHLSSRICRRMKGNMYPAW